MLLSVGVSISYAGPNHAPAGSILAIPAAFLA
jgi:hypothetical protein